jgi:hypothetical protein
MYNVKVKEKVYLLLFTNFYEIMWCQMKWRNVHDLRLQMIIILCYNPGIHLMGLWKTTKKYQRRAIFFTNIPCWFLLDMNHSHPLNSNS